MFILMVFLVPTLLYRIFGFSVNQKHIELNKTK